MSPAAAAKITRSAGSTARSETGVGNENVARIERVAISHSLTLPSSEDEKSRRDGKEPTPQ